MTRFQTRSTRRSHSSSNLTGVEKTIATGFGCLFGCFAIAAWTICILIALAFKVAIIAAIIAGVYWIFTGDWIGDAAFLN